MNLKSFYQFVNEANTISISSPERDAMLFVNTLLPYVGKKEEPGNKGEMVTKFLKSTGLGTGHPWCMAFVYYIFDEFCKTKGLTNPLPKTAAVMSFWNKAPKETKIERSAAEKNPSLIRPGQIFVKGRIGGGHAGIVLKSMGDRFITIDGNSSDQVKLNTYKISDVKGFIDFFPTADNTTADTQERGSGFSAALSAAVDSLIRLNVPTQGGGKED
jgi:hypothetical protein